MATRIPGWVKGVGIGCAAVVILIVAAIAGGVFLLRDAVGEFEDADNWIARVSEQHGAITLYRPDPSGAIPPERIEAFLTVREAASEARSETERSIAGLDGGEGGGDFFRQFTAATTILPRIASYQRGLHQAMLDAGMGHGEYYYLYALTYYAWLGKPVDDGPSFHMVNDHGYFFDTIEEIPEDEVRAARGAFVRTTMNRRMRTVLRNQLEDLAMLDAADVDPEWRKVLEHEIDAMGQDATRLPWQDGVPDVVVSSLGPFRERLEVSYSRLCNVIDVAPAARD